jgi:hypothetical protein
MSKIVLTNVNVRVANVDLSAHINSVTLSSNSAEVETTSFSSAGHVTRVGGLKDDTIALGFHQSFAAASVEATIGSLVGTIGTVVVFPSGTAISATNPRYTCEVLFTEWAPLDGSVGDLSTASITWPCNTVTKATA